MATFLAFPFPLPFAPLGTAPFGFLPARVLGGCPGGRRFGPRPFLHPVLRADIPRGFPGTAFLHLPDVPWVLPLRAALDFRGRGGTLGAAGFHLGGRFPAHLRRPVELRPVRSTAHFGGLGFPLRTAKPIGVPTLGSLGLG